MAIKRADLGRKGGRTCQAKSPNKRVGLVYLHRRKKKNMCEFYSRFLMKMVENYIKIESFLWTVIESLKLMS